MQDKFKISFSAIFIGTIAIAVFVTLNIIIYAKIADVGVFSTFSRSVGMILLILAVY